MKRHRCSARAGIPTGAFSTPRRWRPACSASPFRRLVVTRSSPTSTLPTTVFLPDDLKSRLEGLVAKHSDRFIYGKGSMHDPAPDETAGQTMAIRGDRDPYDGQHPLVRIHEGNGRPALFSTLGYVQGVVDMEDDEARSLLREIHEHQIDDAVVYRHRWEPDMAVVWDNRSVLHRATGGYEGHDRLLRRTTIVR